MIHVVWTVATDYLVALCIYAVASLTLACGRGYWFNGRDRHQLSRYELRLTIPVDVWWVLHVPYTPIFGPVPITDVVDHVGVKAVSWLHGTKDDVANHQGRMVGD